VGKGEKPPLRLPGKPIRIGLWVRGERTGHRLWLRLLDAAGKTADVALGKVDFEGWRLLDEAVPALAPPVGLRALLVRGGNGPLVVDDVTVFTKSPQPLYVAVRPVLPEAHIQEGQRAEFRIDVQSLATTALEARGELRALRAGGQATEAARVGFKFAAAAGRPFSTTVGLRLEAGVYSLQVSAGTTGASRRVVVYPTERSDAPSASRAVRRFGQRGDAMRVYQSAFSPAMVVEARERTVTLFRGLKDVGLSVPRDGLMRIRRVSVKPWRTQLTEPWIMLWFGASAEWSQVTSADGSPCATFDVPFLMVLESVPEEAKVDEGLKLRFRRRGQRIAIVPFFGIRRLDPAQTARWRDNPRILTWLATACRAWVPTLRAFPIGVQEEWRLSGERDVLELRCQFTYLESSSRWGGRATRAAPVPPLLMLARRAGLSVAFSKEPVPTGCNTAVGPYFVVPDAEEYTVRITGLLRFVHRMVADVPPAPLAARVTLARTYATLADDAAKMPFWCSRDDERGRLAADALVRFILSRANADYTWDAESRTLRAFDALTQRRRGDAGAVLAAAEQLRGCWYAAVHAGAWDTLRERWPQVVAVHEVARAPEDWATLGLGTDGAPVDARLNAAVYFARLASRLGTEAEYGEACVAAAKLMIAAYALAEGAPKYTKELGPWPGVTRSDAVFGGCRPGSIGLSPGAAPLVTSPSDAGYGFAGAWLADYFTQRFRPGPLEFYGRTPQDWAGRLFARLSGPPLGKDFAPMRPSSAPYAGNYVVSLGSGPDGWPAAVWTSHRSPAGGPLMFGSIGTEADTRGKLLRRLDATPHLRLSAYGAVKAEPPPTGTEPPPQPPPAPPPAETGDDTRE